MIGEYLIRNGTADFSKDEVLAQFRIAREVMPGNFRRDFSWAIATGWIAEDCPQSGSLLCNAVGQTGGRRKFFG